MPNYADDYEFARGYAWTEISHAGEAYIAFTRSRSEGNEDGDDFVGSAVFRPFVLDLGKSSLAFGIGYAGDISTSDIPGSSDYIGLSEPIEGFEGAAVNLTTIDTSKSVADTALQVVSFSVMGSFPTIGLQVSVDAGYAWSTLKGKADTITQNVELVLPDLGTYNLPVTYEDYRYEQRQEGIFFRCEFRKFFYRNYLNFFSLSFYTIQNIKYTHRVSRVTRATWNLNSLKELFLENTFLVENDVDLPSVIYHPELPDIFFYPLADPQDTDATTRSKKVLEADVYNVNLIARLYTVPVQLGIFHRQGISLDVTGGLSHTTGELLEDNWHGLGISLGGQVSLFDVIFVGYTYTWEQRNDLSDSGALFIGIGLYG